MTSGAFSAALVVFLLLAPGTAAAQQGQAQPPPPPETDTVQLAFDREIFTYPSHQRRNPFRPLGTGDIGPSFEDLVLMGTIVTDSPGEGLALIGLRGSTGGGNTAMSGATHRLRVGQTIGNTRILEIYSRHIFVEVEEFGLTERRVMEVRRTEPRADGDVADDTLSTQGDTTIPPPDTVSTQDDRDGGTAGAGGSGAGTDEDVGPNGNGGT